MRVSVTQLEVITQLYTPATFSNGPILACIALELSFHPCALADPLPLCTDTAVVV